MFQVNFEEQQNGVKIKRRLFDRYAVCVQNSSDRGN